MPTHQLSAPEIGYIDPAKSRDEADGGSNIPDEIYMAYKSNDNLDAFLSDVLGYTDKYISQLTQNDKVYCVKTASEMLVFDVVISPATGAEEGGDEITITGSNMDKVVDVLFDGNSGSALTTVSSSEITVETPAGSGVVDVTIVTSSGSRVFENAFTYSA